MHKTYLGQNTEQVHTRTLTAQNKKGRPPLILLPPAPHSGLYFTAVMPLLNMDRDVIAVDYPGYGGSDPLEETPSIEAYARRLQSVLYRYEPAHVLGFHSGCLVAMELARQNRGSVKHIIMIDIPYFEAETRRAYRQKIVKPTPPPQSIADLKTGFENNVLARKDDLGLARAFALWVETQRAGESQTSAFEAAFSYDCETGFAALDRPVHIIATQSGLLEPSRQAAKVLSKAELLERLDITSSVFDKNAALIAPLILEILAHD